MGTLIQDVRFGRMEQRENAERGTKHRPAQNEPSKNLPRISRITRKQFV